MRKILILLALTVFTINVSAQEEDAVTDKIIDSPYRIYLGPKVGFNMASMSGLSDEFALNPKSGIGFREVWPQTSILDVIKVGKRVLAAQGLSVSKLRPCIRNGQLRLMQKI